MNKKKYFVYAPEFNGIEFFETKEGAEKAYNQFIEDERSEAHSEGEWLACCEEVYMGKVTHKAMLVNSHPEHAELKSVEV